MLGAARSQKPEAGEERESKHMSKKFVIPILGLPIAILFCVAIFWNMKKEQPLSPDKYNEGYMCGFVMNVKGPPTYICFEDPSSMAGFEKGRDDVKSIMSIRSFYKEDPLLRAEQALEFLKSTSEIDEKLRKMATKSIWDWVESLEEK